MARFQRVEKGYMTNKNYVRLWTFQHIDQFHNLWRDGVMRGSWSHVDSRDNVAYRYMCREMENRHLDCDGAPPVWAFHSCDAFQRMPDHDIASMLLSTHDLASGNIVMLSLLCPSSKILLSCYSAWCNLVYFEMPDMDELDRQRQLFDFNPYHIDGDQQIQATLPFIRKEWLMQVNPVILDKNDNARILDATHIYFKGR